jgi:ankyrin repeat protein
VKADAYAKVYGTAIQAAAAHGSREVFELLLAAGADINIKGGKYRHTLAAAVISQNEDIVQMLKNKVIKVEQDILDDALYNAIMQGNAPSIEFLLDIGANLNIKPLDCSSPLEVAVNERHEAAVRELLRIGVDKNGLTTRILHHAIIFGNVGTVIQFLDQGFDQFEANSDGWTVLSLAAVHNAEAVVQLLLERPGVDPVLMARDIELSLFYAKRKDNCRILQLLEEAMKRISESTGPAKPEAVSNHTRPADFG